LDFELWIYYKEGIIMQTTDCAVIKELPGPVNLMLEEERRKLDSLGNEIAAQEKLHYEGYIAFTDVPYSVNQAKLTLLFN
jgi:hypothetical protein